MGREGFCWDPVRAGAAHLELWQWRHNHCRKQASMKTGGLGNRYPDVFCSHPLPPMGGTQPELEDKSITGASPQGTEED